MGIDYRCFLIKHSAQRELARQLGKTNAMVLSSWLYDHYCCRKLFAKNQDTIFGLLA